LTLKLGEALRNMPSLTHTLFAGEGQLPRDSPNFRAYWPQAKVNQHPTSAPSTG